MCLDKPANNRPSCLPTKPGGRGHERVVLQGTALAIRSDPASFNRHSHLQSSSSNHPIRLPRLIFLPSQIKPQRRGILALNSPHITQRPPAGCKANQASCEGQSATCAMCATEDEVDRSGRCRARGNNTTVLSHDLQIWPPNTLSSGEVGYDVTRVSRGGLRLLGGESVGKSRIDIKNGHLVGCEAAWTKDMAGAGDDGAEDVGR